MLSDFRFTQTDMDDALTAERERCAKIAEAFDDFQYERNRSDHYGPDLVNESATRRVLAAKIRSGE